MTRLLTTSVRDNLKSDFYKGTRLANFYNMGDEANAANAAADPADATNPNPAVSNDLNVQQLTQLFSTFQLLQNQNNQINHAVIKAPTFTETSVPGWFTILESQFALRGVTAQKTKFFNVMSSLPADLISRIPSDITAAENYDELKKTVIDVYEQTKPELFDKLLNSNNATVLTGRPSIFLQDLRILGAKVGADDALIRHKFVQALPKHIGPAVASQKTLTLQQLGTLADELLPLLSSDTYKVQAIKQESENKNENNSRYKIPYGLRPFTSNQRPKVCKAHIYYGASATSCRHWCQWPDKADCRIQPNSRASSPSASNENQRSRSKNREYPKNARSGSPRLQ